MAFQIKLNPPKGRHSRAKLTAYKRHWRGIVGVRDEFSSQFIHEGLSVGRLSERSGVGYGTVNRFFHFGQGHGRQTYSYFHGPAATTIFGIADALGLEVKLVRKNGKANGR